jgi:crotonobetainyl-CoA:carnitine CoA-transferase CaiB-like acyl-CoA transferase
MRPFEGIRVIDVTHVLAGPFATYQAPTSSRSSIRTIRIKAVALARIRNLTAARWGPRS